MWKRWLMLLLVVAPSWVLADRLLPENSERGDLEGFVNQMMVISGQAYPVGPGLVVYDTSNRMILSGSIPNVVAPVKFLTGASGEVIRVWLLTDQEAARYVPVRK